MPVPCRVGERQLESETFLVLDGKIFANNAILIVSDARLQAGGVKKVL